MKKVLIVAREYYPNNAPTSQRIHSFARYLPEYGYEPVILCTGWNPDNCKRWWSGGYYDASMEGRDICPVRRVPYEYPNIPFIIDRTMSDLIPFWWPFRQYREMLAAGLKLISREKFDMIVATSPPPFCLSVGKALSAGSNIPWVADMRDVTGEYGITVSWTRPWTFRNFLTIPWQRWLEAKACQSAYAVTTVTPALLEDLKHRGINNVEIIYNGYEPSDFEHIRKEPNEVFQIVHAGRIYPNNEVKPFLEGLRLFTQRSEVECFKVKVDFYGHTTNEVIRLTKNIGLDDFIRFYPRVDRNLILPLLRNAALLLHLSHRKSKGIMTSKLAEYIGSGTPILSVPGDGDIVDQTLQKTAAGRSARDPEEISDFLFNIYVEWKKAGFTSSHIIPEEVGRLTRKAQAEKLAQLLDQSRMTFRHANL